MPVYDVTTPSGHEPPFTLVLLHHAGGSARGFAPLLPHLPRRWRVLGADLPGRLLDRARSRCRTAGEAVDHLCDALRPELTGPYAVFGHSMGALLAFELVRRLEAEALGPCWLGVSAVPPPTGEAGARAAAPAGWPAHRVLRYLHGLGGTPAGTDHRTALAELVARTLRQDLEVAGSYAYVDGPPLRTALSVFGGADDPLAPPHLLRRWSAYTRRPMGCHLWPGGHFYLFDHAEDVSARLVGACRTLLAGDRAAP
ncbi:MULTISPECIES: thioesterase II family protein [Streptomyces]|uniref:Thioesterase n=1 Tax=Streptomyces canarius TaxID=285453 RepID=A0ABQ3CES9_9ACTN|nr:alpha/beta fold hydrolase [Streptomyces canarius]GHA08066.1 thioesterase [Streptomyces canarius]